MVYFQNIILRNIFLFISLFLLLNACGSSKEGDQELHPNLPPYKKIAEERFNKDYKVESNSDSTYLIVYYSPKDKIMNPGIPLKFFVYNTSSKEVIFQDNLANGEIKWKNTYQFVVKTTPEIVKGNDEDTQNSGYTYDVNTKRKLSSHNKNK